MSALSAASLIFIFQFSLLFFHISVTRQHQHCGVLLVLIRNIGHRTLPKIGVGTFLARNVHPRGKTSQPPTMCSQCSRCHPNRFTFGGVIAERVNTVFCPVEYFHDSPEAMLRYGRITRWLYCAECPQYSIHLEARAVASFTTPCFRKKHPLILLAIS